MDKKRIIKGKIETNLKAPLWFTFICICMAILFFIIDVRAGILMSLFVVIYFTFFITMYIKRKPEIMSELMQFAFEQGQVQKELLKELSLPYALLDIEGRILWDNKKFRSIVERKNKKYIYQLFPEITKEVLPKEDTSQVNIKRDTMYYRIEMKHIAIKDLEEDNLTKEEIVQGKNQLIAVYIYDETQVQSYMQQNKDQKLIAGLVYIDNYEEALDSIDEVRRSLLVALIERKINKYMQNIDAICKKIEKDKFFVVFQQKYLAHLQSTKFSLLDEMKTINIGNDMSVTLSISLGVNADSYFQAYEYARVAMDLALGRGGDQAVVKDKEKIYYYGGKTQLVEKSTRVKARVKAHALREIMEAKDKIIVMGHKFPDVDSLGAAIGIYRLAKTLNKKTHIVINEATVSIRSVIHSFKANSAYEEDMFINSDQAIDIVDNNTLLVVVDVNRPSYTECKELLSLTRHIVVLDHHRQTSETIENAVLSYIEPYASSACEMVAEILQYIADKPKLKAIEADAMYFGMLVDTDNFVTKTGVRTFEAAAFLRKNGADVVRVRKMSRDTMEHYKLKAEAVRNAEVFREEYAFSVCPSEGVDSPTVLGAQVANELLDIEGIRASFVFTKLGNQVYISARSIDDVNVQVIMEHLGGGGHLSVAGAQLRDCTVEEAMKQLKQILDKLIEEGDI